ncbi:MAG: HAMP domain-containing histidine kinase, partial [Desulfobulbaceae bacterium]|nr:HAMP domain-containing histidine kinase [Desulfobulbaceae bacterium]
MIHLNLRQKIVAGIVLYIFFYVSLGFSFFKKFEEFNEDVTILIHAIKISNICLEIRRYEKNYIIRHNLNDYETVKKYINEATDYINIVRKDLDIKNYPYLNEAPHYLDKLSTKLLEYKTSFSDLHIGLEDQVDSTILIQEKIQPIGQATINISDEFINYGQSKRAEFISKAKLPIISSLTLLIVFTVITAILLHQKLIAPLKSIEQAANTIAKGTFVPLPVPKQKDEIQRVRQAFNRMVHELEMQQEQLIQAQKLSSIGTLASGTAHQLNNPLNNISTSCQIALDELDQGDLPLISKMLTTIYQETQRASEIVKGLLEFSRAQTFSFQPVALTEVVDRVIKLVSSDIPPGIIIHKKIPKTLILDLDVQKMTEAILNLVLNGIQAIKPLPGSITITALDNKEVGEATIIIEDSGNGIEGENLSKIFDPF